MPDVGEWDHRAKVLNPEHAHFQACASRGVGRKSLTPTSAWTWAGKGTLGSVTLASTHPRAVRSLVVIRDAK